MNSGFKGTINWNKYLGRDPAVDPDHNLHYLVSSIFQRVNKICVLSFENEKGRKGHATYYLLKAEVKDHNVKTNGRTSGAVV